jgi:hypothetical protein
MVAPDGRAAYDSRNSALRVSVARTTCQVTGPGRAFICTIVATACRDAVLAQAFLAAAEPAAIAVTDSHT